MADAEDAENPSIKAIAVTKAPHALTPQLPSIDGDHGTVYRRWTTRAARQVTGG